MSDSTLEAILRRVAQSRIATVRVRRVCGEQAASPGDRPTDGAMRRLLHGSHAA